MRGRRSRAAFTNYRSLFVRAVETHPGLSVSGTDPAVGSVVFAQRTAFTVNVNQPVDATTLQASDFTVNGTPANSVTYTPGTTTITFNYTTSPMTTQGVQTMHIAEGAFLSASGGNPVHEFSGDLPLRRVVARGDQHRPIDWRHVLPARAGHVSI